MNSALYEELTNYLSLRKKVLAPSSFSMEKGVLLSFDRHLSEKERKYKTVTESDVVSWIRPKQNHLEPATIVRHVSFLRSYLKYLQRMGVPVYIPPCPKAPETYSPYLFSDEELEALFNAADSAQILRDARHPHYQMEFPMLLRMLYSCGFRLGELLSVQVRDVDFKRGVVLIRDAKNKKQRMVPMGDSLSEMLNQYCMAMDLMEDSENYLFPHKKSSERHLSKASAYAWFRALLKKTDIRVTRPKKHARGPCLHCFRHLFAVKSFAQSEQAGRSVHDSIPFLSVYLGHSDMNATGKYLKFSGDMFPEHAALFEKYAEGIFPEVRYED